MIDEKVNQWRKDGKHLPKFFRDFHDQKVLIAAMHYYTCKDDIPELKDINLITGHIYITDFLWFMARHGYTIQKTNKNLPFEDIHQNIQSYRLKEQEKFFEMLKNENK